MGHRSGRREPACGSESHPGRTPHQIGDEATGADPARAGLQCRDYALSSAATRRCTTAGQSPMRSGPELPDRLLWHGCCRTSTVPRRRTGRRGVRVGRGRRRARPNLDADDLQPEIIDAAHIGGGPAPSLPARGGTVSLTNGAGAGLDGMSQRRPVGTGRVLLGWARTASRPPTSLSSSRRHPRRPARRLPPADIHAGLLCTALTASEDTVYRSPIRGRRAGGTGARPLEGHVGGRRSSCCSASSA